MNTSFCNKNYSLIENTDLFVDHRKINEFFDKMSELIILQSLIEQETARLGLQSFDIQSNIIELSNISKNIQSLTISLRMVCIKQSLKKTSQIAKDTAKELGKNINIQILGETTEIDRDVVEKIEICLMHIVKNSIAHGIEDQVERIKSGKNEKGTIIIEAYSKKGYVYIEISDDGRGIRLDKIYANAIKKGFLQPDKEYTDAEIMEYIFMPAFSTAEKIDSISGRGVGLDVVKTELMKMGGGIEVNTKIGIGSTFTIKIPLNISVINGTIIKILNDKFIIPTYSIKSIAKVKKEDWISVKGKIKVVKIKEELISVIPINEILGLTPGDINDNEELVVIMEFRKERKALPIKAVLEKREVAVKPIGDTFSKQEFIMGVSILGDGKVAIILDSESLFKV